MNWFDDSKSRILQLLAFPSWLQIMVKFDADNMIGRSGDNTVGWHPCSQTSYETQQ
jgi:hypothetical protein